MDNQTSKKYQDVIVEITGLFFLVLFIYAALSKLLDYRDFKMQLSQSPFLSEFADLVSIGIPAIELLIALLFFFPRLKLVGLYASLGLMLLFTTYIVAVLQFADAVPCSCGGVIASLTWKEHLVFNAACIMLALLGIILKKINTNNRKNIEPLPVTSRDK